jgi:cytochrome P450
MRKGEGVRRDFCSYIFRIKDDMGLNDWHMAAYSNALILAGSETSATVLSALTYFLCRTPRAYETLKKELRARYKSSSEITSLTATFPYLTAVIQEVMRMYPPVPFGMPRVVPRGGETVDGLFIPGGVSLFAIGTKQLS